MTPLETVVYLVLLHTHFTAQQPPPIPSYGKIEACSKAGRAGKVVKVTSYPEVCNSKAVSIQKENIEVRSASSTTGAWTGWVKAKDRGRLLPKGRRFYQFRSSSAPVCTRKEPTVESVDCGEGK